MTFPATHKRIYGLDILRACAILCVMLRHSLDFFVPHFDMFYPGLAIPDGVNLFFVLSGFLIGGILLRTVDESTRPSALWQFWVRRWFRTLPNYFLVLLVLLAAYFFVFHKLPDKAFSYFTFTQAFNSPHPHFFPEAWSLAVEEWFYLLVPAGLFLILRFAKGGRRYVILVYIISVIVAVTMYRCGRINTLWDTHGFNFDFEIQKLVLMRLDAIMFGFAGSYCAHYFPGRWHENKNLLFAAGLVISFGSRAMIALPDVMFFLKYIYLTAISTGALLLLPKLSAVISGRGITYKSVTFISIISYSMYLLNYTLVSRVILPVLSKMAGVQHETNVAVAWLAWGLFWVITIVLSYLLYRFYELPVMNLRNKFGKRGSYILEAGKKSE
jgi:peptidoglycan/LPS O-acetylase OafA/YrhL